MNSGHTLFSGQAQATQNPECKKYIQYSKKFQGNSVFMASASCSKILNDKIYFNTVKNSKETVFQGKRMLLKNPE